MTVPRIGEWEPAALGVHPPAGGTPGGSMPPYIRRPHDEKLRTVLDPAVADSRLVVVRGDAGAGKSRAAYEAVADRLPDWPLEYPPTPAALAARLEAGDVLGQLPEDQGIPYLVVAGEQQGLGHDLGGLGVVVGEGQEQPAAVL